MWKAPSVFETSAAGVVSPGKETVKEKLFYCAHLSLFFFWQEKKEKLAEILWQHTQAPRIPSHHAPVFLSVVSRTSVYFHFLGIVVSKNSLFFFPRVSRSSGGAGPGGVAASTGALSSDSRRAPLLSDTWGIQAIIVHKQNREKNEKKRRNSSIIHRYVGITVTQRMLKWGLRIQQL